MQNLSLGSAPGDAAQVLAELGYVIADKLRIHHATTDRGQAVLQRDGALRDKNAAPAKIRARVAVAFGLLHDVHGIRLEKFHSS